MSNDSDCTLNREKESHSEGDNEYILDENSEAEDDDGYEDEPYASSGEEGSVPQAVAACWGDGKPCKSPSRDYDNEVDF